MIEDADRIRCPRCDQHMEIYSRATASEPVVADMCVTCGGVWLDGAEVAKVYSGFAQLADRLAGAGGAEDPKRHIAICPRCRARPVGFPFFDLTLDHCPSCHGLWVDGEELEDLAKTADRADGLPAPPPAGYRTHAAAAVRAVPVICKGCTVELDLARAEMTSRGPMCASCATEFRQKALDASLEGYEPPKHPLFSLPKMEGFENAQDVADALGAVAGFVSGVLESGPRCSHCGCRSHSRCRH